MQPVHLRLADLISLFCPQFREACSHLMDVQRSVQQSMDRVQQVTRLDYNAQVSLQIMWSRLIHSVHQHAWSL